MAEYRDNGSRFVTALLLGGIAGLVAVFLFAPKSGKELKSKIKEKGSKILMDVEEATKIIDDVQYHAEELMKDLVRVRQKAREIFAGREKREA